MRQSKIEVGGLYENTSGLVVRKVEAFKQSDIGVKDGRTVVYSRVRGARGAIGGDCTLRSFATWAFRRIDTEERRCEYAMVLYFVVLRHAASYPAVRWLPLSPSNQLRYKHVAAHVPIIPMLAEMHSLGWLTPHGAPHSFYRLSDAGAAELVTRGFAERVEVSPALDVPPVEHVAATSGAMLDVYVLFRREEPDER